MENPRPEKVAVVDEVKVRISEAQATILTEYRGLTVKDIAQLRSDLRPHDAEYKVYKNTLVRFAVRDLNLPELEESLTGPTAVTFIKGDPAAVAKALRDFAKTKPNLIVKGGVLGDKILTAQDAAALADLPPREVLLAQLAGLLAQPMVAFAGLLQAVPRNFAYGLKALVDQGGAPGAPASAPAEAAADEAAPEASEEAPAATEDVAAEAPAEAAADAATETPAIPTDSE